QKSRVLDRDSAEKIVDFIRSFADGCHHGKEESHLFVALEAEGASRESGPVGMMLHEHELGRALVKQMADNIVGASKGDEASLSSYINGAVGYVQLLRAHIQKEDGILFPLADDMLSDEVFEKLSEDFEHVESHHMGEGTHQKYLDLAAALAKKFGVDAGPLAGHGSCGCAHKKSTDATEENHAA
ncbi:MAG: hemerythrin domain-containing protein, partial [Candidatus Zixiibacteriota bacterium]